MRFVYFYFMKEALDRVRLTAPVHATYWQSLGLADYLGGPFADKSGGLITFSADSHAEAVRVVSGDPFVREDLLERHWLKQWSLD
jgi:uncharacterized protein